MWVLIAVLAVPLIEIGLFVEIGGAIGLWPTLAWVILTAAFGIMLIRQQGMAQAVRLRSGLREIDPLSPMVHGV